MPVHRVAALDDPVFHPACGSQLAGEFLFRLHHRIVDHVVALDLDNDVGAVVFLDYKVWVVGTDGMGFGIDVLDIKVRLTVRQHAGEIDLVDPPLSEKIPEKSLFGVGVKAVGIQVKTFPPIR